MADKAEKKPIYTVWWFWAIVVVVITSCAIALILSIPKEKGKEYMSPDELSSQIEKNRQSAVEQQRESTLKIVEATKEAVIAYKELNGHYPSKLTDIDGWNENDTVTYSYDGVNTPTVSYYLDGSLKEEPVE